MADTQTISKLIIEIDGTAYELDGGGGGSITPGVPIPHDTVDSDSIINGSVEMEDLNDSVKGKIQKTYVEDDEALHMDYDDYGVNHSGASGASPMLEEEEE